jgi:hypothetical protein
LRKALDFSNPEVNTLLNFNSFLEHTTDNELLTQMI